MSRNAKAGNRIRSEDHFRMSCFSRACFLVRFGLSLAVRIADTRAMLSSGLDECTERRDFEADGGRSNEGRGVAEAFCDGCLARGILDAPALVTRPFA